MLPQREFRKLLTSETENKEEILRRIFKTDRYKLMRELLDQNENNGKTSYKKSRKSESYTSVMFLNYQSVMEQY